MPAPGELNYTKIVKLDLGTVTPSLAGPKRPQDRIDLGHLATKFSELYSKPTAAADATASTEPRRAPASKVATARPAAHATAGRASRSPSATATC